MLIILLSLKHTLSLGELAEKDNNLFASHSVEEAKNIKGKKFNFLIRTNLRYLPKSTKNHEK